jgi:hypothetical protein
MIEKIAEQKNSEIWPEKNESPTIENILSGKAKIKFLSDNTESREVNGKKWVGHSYAYEITVPRPSKSDEEWTTEIINWLPMKSNEAFVETPESQLTIVTGHGEIPITANQETKYKIWDEINRQVNQKENGKI